ncbi:MAG TPA: autotransporter domain-containing protein, partial [Caulobacteraceae bacterium]|nr:autotransporter domain-containing protein [Caulobacteraceae bacterium]
GALSGSGAFSKTGAGILILAAPSTYSGQATVAGGTLRLNGSMGGSFDVLSGATLGGAGSTAGTVTVENGGSLLGLAGQTLTTGALTLNSGSIIQTSLGAPSTQALFHVNGALTLDGTLNISSPGGFGQGLYRLFDYTGALTDNGLAFGTIPATVQAGQLAVQTAIGGQVNLVVSAPAVPPILFWNGGVTSPTGSIAGGSGTWKLGPTNWTDANGAVSAGWNSDFGVFAGAAGVVTVDGSAGGISANGLQFAVDGYTVGGAALTLTGAAPTLRVGDGTAAGAGYTATVNSAIAGAGGLIKTDLGTLVLGGSNTFTGGVTVNGGFVQVSSDANLGAAGGAVTLNGGGLATTGSFASARTLAFAGPGTIRTAGGTSLTLTGPLTGTGAFTKAGTGTLILPGVSSYGGATTVSAGTLRVDGVLPGTVSVQSGARLQGVGQVGAAQVASGGTLAAGDSIGTLTVNGALNLASGSTLEVELDAQGHADLVHTTGAATIGGGTVNILGAPGNYTIGSRYTVLTADGGESGAFSGLTSNVNMLFLKLALNDDANHVFVDVVRNGAAFCSVARTFNQCQAANGADSLGQGKAVFDAVANLNDPAAARGAFDALSGEIGPAVKGVEMDDSRFVRDAANRRLREALAGGDPHGAWGQAFGAWGHADSDGNAGAARRDIGGFVLGADLLASDAWRLGVAGGYSHADVDVASRASTGSLDSYHLAAYGGAKAGPVGVRFGAAYAWHDVRTARAAVFPGFADALTGGYRAGTGQVFGEVGYGWTQGTGTLEPFAGLAHVMLHTDGFTEKGGPAALKSAGQSQSVSFASLGLRAATTIDAGGSEVGLHASAAWRHAFGDRTPTSRYSFAAGGQAFDIDGLPLARDAALLEAGADVKLSGRARLTVSYDGEVGRRISDQGVQARLSVAF